jgi:NADH-quinone oxidoreductase subunit N
MNITIAVVQSIPWVLEAILFIAGLIAWTIFKHNQRFVLYLAGLMFCYFILQTICLYFVFEDYSIVGKGAVLFDKGIIINKIIISGFGAHFLLYFYFEVETLKFKSLEGSFFIFLLIWAFLISLLNFNLFALFIIMEIITLIIIVAMTVYLISVGSKLLQPILYFFVLNVMMSTFYVFGCTLQLYISLPSGVATVSYITFLQTWEMLASFIYDLTGFSLYMRLVIGFLVLIFFFKITIAPFSIWVNAVYKNIPFIFLCVLMTIYKIFFCMVGLTIIFGFIDLVQEWHESLINLFMFALVPSFFIGCLAYRLQDVKTILAFTTVSQFGYIVAGFVTSNPEVTKYSFLYLYLYCLQLFVLFGLTLWIKPTVALAQSQQYNLVQHFNKKYSFLLFIIFFNLAGVPPLFGFFAKYWLLLQFYNAGFFVLAFLGVISSFIMTILYLQLGVQLFYPEVDSTEVLKLEHKKRAFLQTFKNNIMLKIAAYIDKNFLIVGVTNVAATMIAEFILLKLAEYTAAAYYRLSSAIDNILTDKTYMQFFKEEMLVKQVLTWRESQFGLKWLPHEVWPIINENPRLYFLIELEKQGVPENINAVQWLNEFANQGIDYSSFILAQTQLDWHKTGGPRLTLQDFEPFFKKEKNFEDLVILIEQHAGPYNLWSYEPCLNLRHLQAHGEDDLHHRWHQAPASQFHEPLMDFNQWMDKLRTGEDIPYISLHHHDELVKSVAPGRPTFDTDLLWYHIDQQELRAMCKQLVNCEISYTRFVHFLVDHGMGWAHYAHLVPSAHQRPPHLSDWIKEAQLSVNTKNIDTIIQEHFANEMEAVYQQTVPQEEFFSNIKTAQYIDKSLKRFPHAWRDW